VAVAGDGSSAPPGPGMTATAAAGEAGGGAGAGAPQGSGEGRRGQQEVVVVTSWEATPGGADAEHGDGDNAADQMQPQLEWCVALQAELHRLPLAVELAVK
jgi:hypothetical protein